MEYVLHYVLPLLAAESSKSEISGHIYLNYTILLNSVINECFTFTELPGSKNRTCRPRNITTRHESDSCDVKCIHKTTTAEERRNKQVEMASVIMAAQHAHHTRRPSKNGFHSSGMQTESVSLDQTCQFFHNMMLR